jgi:hypothetical protein
MILCRSLEIVDSVDESLFTTLEWLSEEGYLQNNHYFTAGYPFSRSSRFVKVICSMKNLQTLQLWENELTFEDLARMFQSCPKITYLNITNFKFTMLEMFEQLKNQLRPGFQRLRSFAFATSFNKVSWPVIQETLT